MIRRRLALLTVAALAVSAAAALTPAAAAPAAPTGSTSVTVFLKAPHPAALTRLAHAHGLSHAQRAQAVRALLPSAATHRLVKGQLATQGFHVTHETSWSITATAPKTRSAALFGAQAASRHGLLSVPSTLSKFVSAAFTTRTAAPIYHHSTTDALNGTDFRNADTPAGVTPSTGANTTGLTVATLQLANFFGAAQLPPTTGNAASTQAADLTSYATKYGIADPVANHHYKAVFVDGGAPDDPGGGDLEVNLDQQSILSTAPSANQHAYFAPNSDAGFNDVFSAVLDDVLNTTHATAPDPHIVALSASWGLCESGNSPASISALEPILKSLLAAGVTVFASSGDSGIYDCGQTDPSDVDYPASSRSVVGVGGTNLSAATSAPNTGSNWTEKAWNCTTSASCASQAGTGGGGGGASARFPAPAYQSAAIDDAPFKGNAHRLVPDIAADADPDTGFTTFTSDPAYTVLVGGSNDFQVGGTSLAAPISAAQLANTLGDAGHTSGVGDIHGALYSAYAATKGLAVTDANKAFRDVTIGSNGATADRGIDPKVSAQAGYDTVGGLGGVLWSALLPYLTDTHKPGVTRSLTEPSPNTASWNSLKATWSVTRGADTSLLAPTKVTLAAGSSTVFSSSAKSGSKTVTVPGGKTYTLTVIGTDISGRKTTRRSSVTVPLDDSKFNFSTGWTHPTNANDFGGGRSVSKSKGKTAKATVTGKTFKLRVLTGSSYGRINVSVGGAHLKTLNLHASSAGRRTITLETLSKRKSQAFTFTVKDAKTVAIDALDVT